MGNVYRYTECEHCHKTTDAECTFIVHRDPTPITRMEKLGYPTGKIAAHFCGYCGGYIDIMGKGKLTAVTCNCGNFQYQGWSYEEGSKESWEEPEVWELETG